MPIARWINLYPPLLFFGIKVSISADHREVAIEVPLRWYYRNNTGVMFGAVLSVASDPFPALLFQKLLPGTTAWTRAHHIEYLHPCRSSARATYRITDEDVAALAGPLESTGRAFREFEYGFVDRDGTLVARVTNTTYLRARD